MAAPSPPVFDITVLRAQYLCGPNIWTYRPVLEAWLDIGVLEDYPSHRLPGLPERLAQLLPGLEAHRCGVGEVGGFVQRLREGTWAGHILEHVVIELLNLAGMPTGFGQTRSTAQRGIYRMVFRARNEQVARVALTQGRSLLLALISNSAELDTVQTAVRCIREEIDNSCLGPSTQAIVTAATAQGIPHLRLNRGNLVQLGYGSQQRRIWTAETDLTSAIAESIASDKDLTKTLLQQCGVPVPQGQVVDTPADAWDAAQSIGLPVVVKPSDGNHGRGVSLQLQNQIDVEKAFAVAARHGSQVLVERFVPGDEHRLLVVGGRVVAAARGESAQIVGDGRSSVSQLVDLQLNSDQRRGEHEDAPLGRIHTAQDGAVRLELQRQDLSPDDIPDCGRTVLIQRNGNIAIDCTDQVHPEVQYLVGLAARVVGLDIAGVDVVAQDIAQPLSVQGGAVVEVNAGPGLLMHLKPAQGKAHPVGEAICAHLFPPTPPFTEGQTAPYSAGRIPIVGIAGSPVSSSQAQRADPTDVAQLLHWLLRLSGYRSALACRNGLFVNERCLTAQESTDCLAGQRLLMHRAVDAAVFENTAGTILQTGLPYDRCQVAVVTDMAWTAQWGEFDVHDGEAMFKVMRCPVDAVLPTGAAVLHAADADLLPLEALCDGEVIYYAANPELDTLCSHWQQGKRALYVRHDQLVFAHQKSETPLADMASVSLWCQQHRLRPETLLAAVGSAWALGLEHGLIAAGLEAYEPLVSAEIHFANAKVF